MAIDRQRSRSVAEWFSISGLVFRESIKSFLENRNLASAATLAYYGFLSLMPLMLLVVYLLGMIMKSSDAVLSAMQEMTSRIFPTFSGAILEDLLRLSQQRVWGLISVIILLWSITPFAGAIRSAIFQIFKAETRTHFLRDKFMDLMAVLALLILFIVLSAGKMMAAHRVIEAVSEYRYLFIVLKSILLFGAVVIVLALFFWVFAPVKVKWSHLLAGAMTTMILLAIIRPLFGLFLQFNPNYGYAFGSLKAIFLLIIWVYYTFAVILFGAEVLANTGRRDALLLRGVFIAQKPAGVESRLVSRFIRIHHEGDILFREGDAGKEMFYVLSGEVALKKGDRLILKLGPGSYFGEMSMLLSAPRTATAEIASEECRVIAISQDNFETIIRENPRIVRSLLKEMAQRLKATNERIG